MVNALQRCPTTPPVPAAIGIDSIRLHNLRCRDSVSNFIFASRVSNVTDQIVSCIEKKQKTRDCATQTHAVASSICRCAQGQKITTGAVLNAETNTDAVEQQTQTSGAEALLALAKPRAQGSTLAATPSHPVAITASQDHAATRAGTVSAVANILRHCLKNLKKVDKQKQATRAVQIYEQTADRILHCLRLHCLSSKHAKLAILAVSLCCKQWLVVLKNIIPSLKAGEINRQRDKARLCHSEARAVLRAMYFFAQRTCPAPGSGSWLQI
jgi:hypothetical protein